MARTLTPAAAAATTAQAAALLDTVNDWTAGAGRLDLTYLVQVAADLTGYPTDDFKDAAGDYLWELAADIVVYGGLTDAPEVNRRGRELAAARTAAYRAGQKARELANSDYDYHVQAYGTRGQALMDTAPFSDMGMYASRPTEEKAEEWAANAFATDARVEYVAVSIYRRSAETVGWVFHRSVKTIIRPDGI